MSLLRGKIALALIVCLGITLELQAQQFTQFSNYLLNSLSVNPGYAGSKDHAEIMFSTRKQWNQLNGSPQTTTVNAHTPIADKNLGAGVVTIRDNIGYSSTTSVSLNLARKVSLDKFKLQFGINAGFSSHQTNWDELKTVQANDNTFINGPENEFSPVIGSGLFLYNNSFYIGLSTPNLLQSSSAFYDKKRHYYLSLGKVFDITEKIALKPSVMIKETKASPTQFDLSGTVILQQTIGLGMTHRTGAGNSFFMQLFTPSRWTVAYAFDKMTNGLDQIENGTHELTLIYGFKSSHVTIYNPRYF